MFASLSTGQTLAFDRHGLERAVPIVLLHGLSGDRRTYDPIVTALLQGRVGRGEFQVVNVDLRGHGDSTWADLDMYDAHSYAADVAELITATVGRAAVVVGHSLGGVVAGQLAAAHPEVVRGLFLEDPPFFEGDDAVRNASPVASFFPMLVAAVRDLQTRRASDAEFAELALSHTAPDEVEERVNSLRRWHATTMQAAIDGIVWRGFDPIATLDVPMTILRADPACGAVFQEADGDRVVAANPQARVVMVPGATHGIHAAATRTEYLAELDRFLASIA